MHNATQRAHIRTWPGLALLGVTAQLMSGCGAGSRMPAPHMPLPAGADVRAVLPIFHGHSGAHATWNEVLDAAVSADVIVIGEMHDDLVGHRVQLAFVEDALERWPGMALSMEMLDRSEQATVDDYLAELIDREVFIERIADTKWRRLAKQFLDREIDRSKFRKGILNPGWYNWEWFYQPIIDAVRAGDGRIVAANAPWLRYTRLIDENGYAALEELSDAQRALFAIPTAIPQGRYNERFREFMSGGHGEESDEEPREVDEDRFLEAFRSQLLYDATMGDSIARALDDGATKVVHLVGQFHSDYEGGTVLEVKSRRPRTSVLVISLRDSPETSLHEDDVDRGDFVIYTRLPDGA